MSNQPGTHKRAKNIANAIRTGWKAVRGITGNVISGLGGWAEMGLKATEITLEAADTVMSFIVTDSCVRTALTYTIKMVKDLRSVTRGIQNFGQWVAGTKTLGDLWNDLLGYFEKGHYVVDLVLETMLIDGADIGIETNKRGSILVLKFDDPLISDKQKHPDVDTYDLKSAFIFHKWNPRHIKTSYSWKWESLWRYEQEIYLEHVPLPDDPPTRVSNTSVSILWGHGGISFVTEQEWKTKIKSSSQLYQDTLHSPVKPLYIKDGQALVDAHNKGEDFKIVFKGIHLQSVNCYSLPDGKGSFVRLSFDK